MAKSGAELQAEWWQDWWAKDFSWAGLAAKSVGKTFATIHGGRNREPDLQAYWRRDPHTDAARDDAQLEAAGELLRAPDGALWHLAHVPLHWASGEEAKAAWDAPRREELAALIAARVAAAAETEVDTWCNATGQDGRAQLAGAVLLMPPNHPTNTAAALHLVCDRAWLPGWSGQGLKFGPGFRCRYGVFFEKTRFHNAYFLGNARFDNASFLKDAHFLTVSFSGDVSFRKTAFSGKTEFSGTFSGNTTFEDSSFSGNVKFNSGNFQGTATFDKARFETRAEFAAASFASPAYFRAIIWPEQAADWHGMFEQAEFKSLANFKGAGLRRFAAFDGAILQGGLQLDDAAEADANETFGCERAQAETLPDREAALQQLEGGCRVLKQAMEKSANKTREHVFFAFELMARRHQRGTPWWERQFSRLYGFAGDYGRSIGRPLFGLLALIVVFTVLYAALAFVGHGEALAALPVCAVWLECLHLSMQRVFPFGPWTLTPAQLAQNPVQLALQGTTGSQFGSIIRALGTLQSLLALALAFLAGLALRRRFQMN